MIILRSVLFNILFYLHLVGLMLVGSPCLLMGPHATLQVARLWGRNSVWLLDKVCNLKTRDVGLEHIPPGSAIIAPKHHSIFETFALTVPIDNFTFIVKRELTWIPFFGWYIAAAHQLAINRSKGGSALAQVAALARQILPLGHRIFIFPEGTRRPAGAPPLYKYGVTHLYMETGVACLPVALNAGLFWPRRSFLRWPGTITIEFLPVIEPGLERQAFAALLQDRIETATNRLMAEQLALNPALATNMYRATAAENKNRPLDNA